MSGHAVVDGSNIATEGRTEPSLKQLREAVKAFGDEFHFRRITVIVDASFEHRVAETERRTARRAIDHGDIITPPAGVIGRGDAFILEVADKADAVVLSNDSFQEFHGSYRWLFDEGRLLGGKPVPGVGWVFVTRSPVRGPVSRRATSKRAPAKKAPARKPAEKSADKATTKKKTTTKKSTTKKAPGRTRSRRSGAAAAASNEGSNDARVWEQFQHDYPVGSTVAAVVERFSSHGAYATVDDAVVYLPSRLLGEPPPTRARDVIEVGQTVDVVVHRYDAERRGIDAGLIPVPGRPAAAAKKTRAKRTATKKSAKKAPAKKTTTKKTTKKAPAKKTTTKKSAKKAPAKKTTTKKTTTKRASSRRSGGARNRAARSTTTSSAEK